MNCHRRHRKTPVCRSRFEQAVHLAFWLLFAILVLTACSGEETPPATPTLMPTVTIPPPTPTPLPDNATTGARILARGHLVVGIRYDLQPFGYVTREGQVAGFDVDLGHELARRWLGDAEAVQFRQVRSDTAIDHLLAGDVDIAIAALTHTQEREAGADFSQPYFVDGQALLVRAADAAPPYGGGAINGPASLAGRPVAVVAWSGAEESLWGAVAFTPTIQTYSRFDEAVEALSFGGVDAVADLRQRLFRGKSLFPEAAIVGQYTSAPLAVAFPQNDAFFADLVNLTFQEMIADGTLAVLYARWFDPEQPPAVERWPGEGAPPLADTPMTVDTRDTIAAIQSRGRLAVAMVNDRAPFAYLNEEGSPIGYDVSLVRAMAERWLNDATAMDVMSVPADTGMQLLHTGQVDLLIGGVAHNRAVEMSIDLSLTTYIAGEGLMIQAGSPITDIASLQGQQVAVIEGSQSREVLLTAAQNAGVSLTVLPQPNLDAALARLQEGQVAAIAADRATLLGPAYATPGLGVLSLRLTQIPLALGLPPGDSAFRDLINLTLQTMKSDGQLDPIYSAWFDDAPPALEIWPGAPYRTLRLR